MLQQLIISIGALLLAPILYKLIYSYQGSWKLINRGISLGITLMVLLHLLPESVEAAGYSALLLALLGLILPTVFERLFYQGAEKIHKIFVFISVLGLAFHGFLDGLGIALPHLGHEHCEHGAHAHSHMLPYMIMLHRIPEGMILCQLFLNDKQPKKLIFLFALLILTSIIGFLSAEHFAPLLEDGLTVAYFEAFVCGVLLHISLDHHDICAHKKSFHCHDPETPDGKTPNHSHHHH